MNITIVYTLIALIIALVPWLIPDCSLMMKIIIFLFLIIAYLIFWLIQKATELNKLKSEHKDLTEKHQAISALFDEKQHKIDSYNFCFDSIEFIIAAAVQSKSEDRLSILQESFLKIKESLISSQR